MDSNATTRAARSPGETAARKGAATLRTQVAVRLGLAGGALIIVGMVAAWSSVRSREAARERRSISQRRALEVSLLEALLEAESSHRGFLLTGDTAFLAGYRVKTGALRAQLADLGANVAPLPDHGEAVRRLDSLARVKVEEMDRGISLRLAGNGPAALEAVRAGAGRRIMDEFRSEVQALVRSEEGVYDLWDARLRFDDRLSFLTSTAGVLLTVVFLALTAVTIRRSILARERAEMAAHDSEQRIFQLLEALPVAVFVIDGNGQPFYTNAASRAILGRPIEPGASATSLPETYQAYVAGTNQLYPAEQQPVMRALAGERVYAEDLELHRPEGVVPLEIWAAPVHDAAGRISHAVAVFSDITDRQKAREAIRHLNEQLNRQVQELTDLNAELEAFTYSVSHDLRAPVRHIDGFSRILEETAGAGMDESARHYLDRIRSGARQMGLLIDDLLRLSRVGRHELSLRETDLGPLVHGVVRDLGEETEGRDIEWRVSDLPSVACDPALVKHVFVNLLTNAVKFTRTRPRAVIEVETAFANGTPAVVVRDNGVGFDMRYADKLFGVFQRLHHASDFEGTGVGLAIVHRVVRRHGGRIWAEAAPDAGAAFYFTLTSEPG